MNDVVQGFRDTWGFPNCGGSIDGSHIPKTAPVEFHTDYYNRKGWYSMIVQAVADHKYRFMDIYTGWPGSVHDARVFANSTIYKKGMEGQLFHNLTKEVDGEDLPVVLLGDSAYPLLPWLMKPFPHNGVLSRDQQHYNYQLSRARIVIENAFGRLKARWRCLMKRLDVKPQNTALVITACCVLHNICEVHGEEFDIDWLSEHDDHDHFPQPQGENSSPEEKTSSTIRDILVTHFHNE